MLIDDFSNNLKLIVSITLDIGLQGLLRDDFIREALHFNLDLKWVPLQDHEFVAEICRVLIDRNPYCHRVVL